MASHPSGISNTILIAIIISVLIIFFICVVCFIWKFRKVNKSDALPLDSIVPEKQRNSTTNSSIVLAEVERAKDFRERARVITIGKPRFKKSHKRQGSNSLYTRALAFRTLDDNEFRLHFNDIHRGSYSESTTDNDSARYTSSDIFETPRIIQFTHYNNSTNNNDNYNDNSDNNSYIITNSNNNSNNNITNFNNNCNNNNIANNSNNGFDNYERHYTTVEDIFESFPEDP